MNQTQVETTNQISQQEFVDYRYRWAILVLFCMPSMMNGMSWITFSPISSQIQKSYDQTQFVVTMTSLSYMFIYIILNFPSNFSLQKSIKLGIWIGSIMTIGGAWIRILINDNFWWAIFGQFLGGIGQPFILNAPSKIAATWFKPEQRQTATSVMALINIVGTGLGFIFPGFFVDSGNSAQTTDQVFTMLLWQAIVITICIFPSLVFFREKPPTPPSISADSEKMTFKEAFKSAINNRNFIYLAIAFGCILGNINSLSTIIDFYLTQFNYSKDDSGYFGAIFILSGLIGSGVLTTVVQKTNAYKKVMVCSCIASVLFSGLQMGFLALENVELLLLACFLMGFFSTPLIPISMEFACEITFPMSEPFSSGLVLTSGQIVGVILISISSYVIQLDSKKQVLISEAVGIFVQAIGCIFFLLLKEDLKRKKSEKQGESIEENGVNEVVPLQNIKSSSFEMNKNMENAN